MTVRTTRSLRVTNLVLGVSIAGDEPHSNVKNVLYHSILNVTSHTMYENKINIVLNFEVNMSRQS